MHKEVPSRHFGKIEREKMPTLNLGTTKAKVEWCLVNKPKTREDDTILALSVWKYFHEEDYKHLLYVSLKSLHIDIPSLLTLMPGSHMNKLPSFESCRRLRQKFNEAGQYLPEDKAVLKRRGIKFEEVLDYVREET